MELVKKTTELLVLRMDGNESLANALRRSVAEVPTLAIDEIEVFKNDSVLYDEMLALRLGLVPLKTERGMTKKTKIDLKLSKTGAGTVYASDLDGNAEPVYGNIPLVYLGEGHKLELVATAVLGKGVEHAKFTPGLCYYRHIVEVKSSPNADEIVKNSKGLIAPEKKGSKWICDLNESEVEKIEGLEKGAVSPVDEMLFIIESYGNMDAKDILTKAIAALEDNLKVFEKSLK